MSSLFEPGLARLNHLTLIRASGVDAVDFLHSQLTNDIKSLQDNHACLAGYCTPKGRLLATMLLWKTDGAITLTVAAELQESLQKRLQMFVMRSKVKLDHLGATQVTFGIVGEAVAQELAAWFPVLPDAPYRLTHNQHGTLLRLTDVDGLARYQCIVTADMAPHIEAAAQRRLSESDWLRTEIHAGIPQVTAATVEKFVPQMLNYELIGGVNFKKGCYPGQEIVARTHYLGKQKRRTLLAQLSTANVSNGMEVFASTDPDQPCGMVVNTAPNKVGGCDCLIEIKTGILSDAVVTLQNGAVCHWLALPYALPDDAAQSS